MGLQDDAVPYDVDVLRAGQEVTVGAGTTAMLVVAGPGEARRSTTHRTTYTADRLDGTTTRLAAVLPSADANPPEWELPPRSELVLLPDGRVSVGDPNGELLAGIDAPWAVDSTGRALPTRYEIHGTVLRQIVEATPETQFPVVADPTFTQFPGYWTATLNRTESASAVGTVASCAAVFQKAPHPGLRALTITCASLAAFSAAQLAGGKCVKVHVAGIPPVVATWWPTFPKC